ncbi:Salicylate hydroxylase [Klebsiella michiganensis]|nr:Salicylate hydroxylase [Klebsiella michiganensis]
MKALVIGGGIGGLSAAVALKNAGIHCEVFEAVKEIKPVGAAISIWPNGVKCMKHLGMGDIIESYGGPMYFLAYKDYLRGETLTQFSLAPLVARTGGRPCPVSRAELQREMLDFWGATPCSLVNASPAAKKTPTGFASGLPTGRWRKAIF